MKYHPVCFHSKPLILGLLLMAGASSTVCAAAPAVNVQHDGTNVIVNFTGRLQTAPRAEGPYASVAGANSPHLASATNAATQFWRAALNDVRAIAAGQGFSLAVQKNGTLWAWGGNDRGQLGIGNTNGVVEPVQVGTNTNWRTVSGGAGAYHALAIRDDGTLWAWGDNRFGQLGLGHTNGVLEPVQVGTNTIWESVSAGWLETFALRTDGTVWAWGDNRYGQLGLGSANELPVMLPVQVGNDSNWKSIAAGRGMLQPGQDSFLRFAHCLALKEDGTLWAWGNNQQGQLGLGTYVTNAPYGITQPTQVGTNTDWSTVSSGGNHSVAARKDGTLWVWGSNREGQLNPDTPFGSDFNGTNLTVQFGTNADWRMVSAGGHFSMSIRADGSLWAWGGDFAFQLGIGISTTEYQTRYPTPTGPAPWRVVANGKWQTVAAGQFHTVALRDDGSIWTWGDGGLGRNTVGSSTNVQVGTESNWVTVDAGRDYTIALRQDGTLWGWGWNEGGVLGLGTFGDRTQPTQIGTATDWQQVDAGSSQIVAIRTDGTLWTWGRGHGLPDQVGTETNWIAASAGGDSTEIYYDGIHFMALRRDGTLWAWGQNQYGELGIGTNPGWPYFVTNVTQVGTNNDWRAVSAGWFHTMGIRQDGTLWAWGANGPGALGLGVAVQSTNQPAQVGTRSDWVAVYAGRFATRALRADGTLWIWGNTATNGFTVPVYEPVQFGTDTDWRHVSTDDNHFYHEGADPVWPWKSVASGWRHFVGIRYDGTLWASGDNSVGQLGQPTFWNPAPIAGNLWGPPLPMTE